MSLGASLHIFGCSSRYARMDAGRSFSSPTRHDVALSTHRFPNGGVAPNRVHAQCPADPTDAPFALEFEPDPVPSPKYS